MLEVISQRDLPTVLLIDDDMVSREVMATILTMSGYTVHTAEDGAGSIDLLARRECDPTIILMDAQMPGLNGLELMRVLRAQTNARIYVISASPIGEDVMDAADGFLMKPFQPEALTRLLAEQEAKARPAPEGGLDPAEPVLDRATLTQLKQMMPAAGVRQIFEAILADLERRGEALKASVSRKDWAEARRIGHAIKGGCAMAGAVQLARLGAAIEGGALEASVYQPDNSTNILMDLRAAQQNLRRMLEVEFETQV